MSPRTPGFTVWRIDSYDEIFNVSKLKSGAEWNLSEIKSVRQTATVRWRRMYDAICESVSVT
jgi:hypothetical protein